MYAPCFSRLTKGQAREAADDDVLTQLSNFLLVGHRHIGGKRKHLQRLVTVMRQSKSWSGSLQSSCHVPVLQYFLHCFLLILQPLLPEQSGFFKLFLQATYMGLLQTIWPPHRGKCTNLYSLAGINRWKAWLILANQHVYIQ